MRFRLAAGLLVVLTGVGGTAYAQQTALSTQLAVTGGAVTFDLSGTGTAPGVAVRLLTPVRGGLGLELGTLVAWPQQAFGDSRLVVPEVQLQYHWLLGRLAPYAGGGVGLAANMADGFETDWDGTLAATAGTRVRIHDAVAAVVEFRLRGIEWDFAGTTAEWMGGISVRLSR